MKSRRVGF